MPANKITLSEALEDYVARRKRMGFSDHTIMNDRSNIGALVRHVERHKPIQVRHVTSDHVFDLFYGEGGLHSYHPDSNGTLRKPIRETTHNAYRKKIQLNAYCAHIVPSAAGRELTGWTTSVPGAPGDNGRLRERPASDSRPAESPADDHDRGDIGRNAARAQVQRMMHGKPFLTAMVDDSNVVPLRRSGGPVRLPAGVRQLDLMTVQALIAGSLSFAHIHELANAEGQTGWKGWMYPLSVDLLMVAAWQRLGRARACGDPALLPGPDRKWFRLRYPSRKRKRRQCRNRKSSRNRKRTRHPRRNRSTI